MIHHKSHQFAFKALVVFSALIMSIGGVFSVIEGYHHHLFTRIAEGGIFLLYGGVILYHLWKVRLQ